MTVRVAIKYYNAPGHTLSHASTQDWEKSDLRCPFCGEPSVWNETGDGDYYYGVPHGCLACGAAFTIQAGDMADDAHKQAIAQISAAAKGGQP